jgi:hypothetical protein
MSVHIHFPTPRRMAKGMLDRMLWAEHMIGSAPIAAALVFSYFNSERWLTALELSVIAEVSEDTARRQLRKLVRIGRVWERVEQRSRVYRLDPVLAQKAIDMCIDVWSKVPG